MHTDRSLSLLHRAFTVKYIPASSNRTPTEVYRYSTSAADPKAAGSVQLDPDLEELNLRNLGGESLTPTGS
ncbi:hypothetical protein HPC62_09225 [Thermoleptolyngbya sichuanensis A183]|uniref:Uncharacterized protein n=1 Tax=Thermoleptolyngbya sichuanensis A183 TaxID=2737172 RepID=A0A6M8BDI7_9CYAN|nr:MULTISPECIES: hypothetical protein [Thermoleptolyngbya]QKD82340.1 hypothetical protein HPC62_09225 [Thermoleptolyngbya sichuanensis A183]